MSILLDAANLKVLITILSISIKRFLRASKMTLENYVTYDFQASLYIPEGLTHQHYKFSTCEVRFYNLHLKYSLSLPTGTLYTFIGLSSVLGI